MDGFNVFPSEVKCDAGKLNFGRDYLKTAKLIMYPLVQPVIMWRNGGIAPFYLRHQMEVSGSFHPNRFNRGTH
jgi:hypothetical protein